MTRAEHHAESDADTVADGKAILARELQRCVGREHAVSSKALAWVVTWHLPAGEALRPTTIRDMVREVRREYDVPAASCSDGYYLLRDTDDLEREIRRINEEIATKKQTKRDLVRAWNAQRYDT